MIARDRALAFRAPPVLSAYWVRPGLLAGAYPSVHHNAPLSQERIVRLMEAGVSVFVDLTEEHEHATYLPLVQAAAEPRAQPVAHHRLAIADYHIPTVAEMTRILKLLDATIASGHTTYLHCWGGIGRTGTVVGCYLVRHGMSGEAALREVMRLRRNALCGEMPSPETAEQRQFVLEWPNGM